jgi:branched-subunit amino acid ABC-type transport system permease component
MVISYGVLALVLVLRPYGLFNAMARRPGQAEGA